MLKMNFNSKMTVFPFMLLSDAPQTLIGWETLFYIYHEHWLYYYCSLELVAGCIKYTNVIYKLREKAFLVKNSFIVRTPTKTIKLYYVNSVCDNTGPRTDLMKNQRKFFFFCF